MSSLSAHDRSDDPNPAPAPGPFVLLVDDSSSCLGLLREILATEGHRCIEAGSGLEALGRCDRDRPAAVVTDFSMPGLHGGELADRLVARHPGLPIILVTGQDPEEPAIAAVRGRFVAVLSKPVQPSTLLGLIGEILPPAEVQGAGVP